MDIVTCNQDRDTEQPLTQPRPRVGQVVGVCLGPHVEVVAVVSPLGDTNLVTTSASKISIRRFVITEKAPTRAFSWLKVLSHLRHY